MNLVEQLYNYNTRNAIAQQWIGFTQNRIDQTPYFKPSEWNLCFTQTRRDQQDWI